MTRNQHTQAQMQGSEQSMTGANHPREHSWFDMFGELGNRPVNILVTGATGCGKSSTINALFAADKAKVGQSPDPETMAIEQYQFNNLVLFDSPGLGDGRESDIRHARNIINKLEECDENGELLIDLVLVVLDGSSRDLGTSFELINEVIIPALGEHTDRLLVGINQADMAMKGRHWDPINNQPQPPLEAFLRDKIQSTKRRINEATGEDVEVVHYAAGYKEGDEQQPPYNMGKLFAYILRHVKASKRVALMRDINRDKAMRKHNDSDEDYRESVRKSLWESVTEGAEKGAELGSHFGTPGKMLGAAAGAAVGFVVGLFS